MTGDLYLHECQKNNNNNNKSEWLLILYLYSVCNEKNQGEKHLFESKEFKKLKSTDRKNQRDRFSKTN